MIDWTKIESLKSEIGAEDFEEVVELFLEEVGEAIENLKSDASRSNLEADLHFLKGSSMNLGFTEFSGLCHTGEAQAAAGQANAVDLPTILASYDASKAAFLENLGKT